VTSTRCETVRAALRVLGVVDAPEPLVHLVAELGTITPGHVRVAIEAYNLGVADGERQR
jgi:hypothetical protein